MSDLLQSIAYALQFSEKKAVLITGKNISVIPFPELVQEVEDYIHSPEYKESVYGHNKHSDNSKSCIST